jgi:hypothetical protein
MNELYTQMKNRHQREVNALPLMFAYSKDQFDEGCRKLGVTDPKTDLYKTGDNGTFYRKADSKLILDTFRRLDAEMTEAMKDEDFAVSAFEYEAGNHEFHINLDPHFDMGDFFGYPTESRDGYGVILWEKVPNGEFLQKCYDKGVRKFLARAQYC